jgi:hypothetical protein
MRSKKVIERKVWELLKSSAKLDTDSLEFQVEIGLIAALQWVLGTECGDIVRKDDSDRDCNQTR